MSEQKPNCYLASPYGFAESTKIFYYKSLLPMLRKYVTVLDPWAYDMSNIFAAAVSERQPLLTKLGQHHLHTIRTKAALVIACLDQEPPDNGVIVEIAYAAAHNIPIIGYRNDVRTSGEEAMKYNLMISAAIKESGGVEVDSLDALEEELRHPTTGVIRILLGA